MWLLFQYKLNRLQGEDNNYDVSVEEWELILLSDMVSSYIKIIVDSVYTTGTSGFSEIIMYGNYGKCSLLNELILTFVILSALWLYVDIFPCMVFNLCMLVFYIFVHIVKSVELSGGL